MLPQWLAADQLNCCGSRVVGSPSASFVLISVLPLAQLAALSPVCLFLAHVIVQLGEVFPLLLIFWLTGLSLPLVVQIGMPNLQKGQIPGGNLMGCNLRVTQRDTPQQGGLVTSVMVPVLFGLPGLWEGIL